MLNRLTIRFQSALLAITVATVACLLLGAPVPSRAAPVTDLADQLRLRLESQRIGIPLKVGGDDLRAVTPLQEFYAHRLYQPVWFGNDGLSSAAHAIPGLLASGADDGLRPDDYRYPLLHDTVAAYREGRRPMAPVDLELALTDAVLAYASDMLRGRVRSETLYANWESAPREMDLAQYLQEALDAGRLIAALQDLAPEHAHYGRLRELLSRYRQIEREGGQLTVPPGDTLKIGLRSERVAALRGRLVQSGDLPAGAQSGDHPGGAHYPGRNLYDADLEMAVTRYQGRYGLKTDGVAGPETLKSLNVPLAQRIRTIALNMERWRWLPKHLGERFITVNIAGFELNVVEQDKVTLTMPVVVGKPYHATPVFSEMMSDLIFSPYWNVPQSIAVNEILPKLRENPEYLEQESMQVFRGWDQPVTPIEPADIAWPRVEARNFPYRFRQLPGPHNALGRVKFMFPNKYSVYLHDTPSKALFARASRDFSHGCVRVSEPMRLAQYLLRDQPDWDAGRMEAAATRGVEQSVSLAQPIAVHVLYWTAWVGRGGDVHFRDDVYGRDAKLATAL